jgi:hypothetical protein
MICHVCHQPASGQCKSCLRFYCPQHGDLTCVDCAGVRAGPPPAPEPTDGPAVALGASCYLCDREADGACRQCGRFICPAHRSLLGPVCRPCNWKTLWVVVAIVSIVGAAAIALITRPLR